MRCALTFLGCVALAAAQVGTVDTVGGTTYDWQQIGPPYRTIVNSPYYGIHVTWMYSASNETSFPDRNIRYNFLDYTIGAWNWIHPDYMQSGVNVYTERSGYGNLVGDAVTGVAVISTHNGSPLRPVLARDMVPGAGLFEYCDGGPVMEGFLWPYIAGGDDGTVHCACMDDASREQLHYSAVRSWCTWDSATRISPPGTDPAYPDHNIAASPNTPDVVVTWSRNEEDPKVVYYRESTDRGLTWGAVQNPPLPPAFGGDTGVTCDWMGAFPFYDSDGDLHVAVTVLPVVDSVVQITPVELWHWCDENTPAWSKIHRAGGPPEHLRAPIGYSGVFADRPSIGEDDRGRLYVTWEQFDSTNVEPRSDLLRADIWFCYDNRDNGRSWQDGWRITDPDSSSKRFPCVMDRMREGDVRIKYMMDLCAGFYVQGEGEVTNNPIVVHAPFGHGVEERTEGGGVKAEPVVPTVMRALDLARMECRVMDIMGRDVTDSKEVLRPGVYFLLRIAADERQLSGSSVLREPQAARVRKVVVQR